MITIYLFTGILIMSGLFVWDYIQKGITPKDVLETPWDCLALFIAIILWPMSVYYVLFHREKK